MNSRRLRRIRLIALLLIFVLAGYYAGDYLWSQRSLPAAPDWQPAAGDLVIELPDFVLTDLAGQPRAIAEWSTDTLLINFWATWCAPCRREMPLLQQLQTERQEDGFTVIGIAVDRLPEVEAFITESGITYPILIGQQDAMDAAEQFGPEFVGLPFSIFTAPGGQVLTFHAGELHPEDLAGILAVIDAVTAGRLSVTDARTRLETL